MGFNTEKAAGESNLDDIIIAVNNELKGVARNMGATEIWRRVTKSKKLIARR